MKKQLLTLVFSLFGLSAFAQTSIEEITTTLKPENSLSFSVIGSNIFGTDYVDGLFYLYDKVWNQLDKHDAKQKTEKCLISKSASRTMEYDSSLGKYKVTGWNDNEGGYYEYKTYRYSPINTTQFYTGEEDKLFLFRMKEESFLSKHTISVYSDALNGIGGQVSGTFNSYSRICTELHLIDWDGNVLQTVAFPYYMSSVSPQLLTVEDKTYLIVGAYSIYNKGIIKDVDLHSSKAYDIDDAEVEPEFYHHFIYEYDKGTNGVRFIQTTKNAKGDKWEIGRYEMNGMRYESPQKGVNIIHYSDGTTRKVLVK